MNNRVIKKSLKGGSSAFLVRMMNPLTLLKTNEEESKERKKAQSFEEIKKLRGRNFREDCENELKELESERGLLREKLESRRNQNLVDNEKNRLDNENELKELESKRDLLREKLESTRKQNQLDNKNDSERKLLELKLIIKIKKNFKGLYSPGYYSPHYTEWKKNYWTHLNVNQKIVNITCINQSIVRYIKPKKRIDIENKVGSTQIISIIHDIQTALIVNSCMKRNTQSGMFNWKIGSWSIKNVELAEQRTKIASYLHGKLQEQLDKYNAKETYYDKAKMLVGLEQQVLHLLTQTQYVNMKANKLFRRKIDGFGSLDNLLKKKIKEVESFAASTVLRMRY